MGVLEVLPAPQRGKEVLRRRGEVRAFPEDVVEARDARMFDRISSVGAWRRSTVGMELRIHAGSDIDPRWLDDVEVAIHAVGIGRRTGFISMRLDRDEDPADIRLQVILSDPARELAAFLPDAPERVTLVSRRSASRTFPLTDLSQ